MFSKLAASLIQKAATLGYDITLGEAWRDPEEAKINAKKGTGIAGSLHCDRLAIDLELWRNGMWLTDSSSYKPLGDIWKSWSTPDYQCCWGGDFKKKDGNHFSIAHNGFE